MARECNRQRSPAWSPQLPSIPELEPLELGPLDADCSGNQAEAQTDACKAPEDLRSSWYDAELQKALHVLILSDYAEPFTDARSSSSMSLQAVVQRFQDGKYENNADTFWLDVQACWDCSERTFSDPESCYMAQEMRAIAEELELDFWDRWSRLVQSPWEAQLGAWVRDSWTLSKVADMGEWLYM